MFESIEGKPCRPRSDRTKFPTQQGLFGKPTVINNVETFTAVPIIMMETGKKWSQSAKGENGEFGVKIYNVVGDCLDKSKFMEYPVGVKFSTILDELGIRDKVMAAEIGGSTDPITLAKDFDKPLGFKQGTLSGMGSIVLFGHNRNLEDIYKNKMEFMK